MSTLAQFAYVPLVIFGAYTIGYALGHLIHALERRRRQS